ncbi:MAG: rRNA methyltransferase [Alphaproteobacteria bacterium]|jgi:23S rRNA (pseudouridine1915-N3)-methyltransferase|nr:rRNA methyltransferase [Alphaproteobacteria bacterium]
MRLAIVAVGKARASPERDLYQHYAKRIVWPLKLIEVEEKKRLSAAELKTAEARLLLDAVPARATIWALDGRGKTLSSQELAAALAKRQAAGEADLALLIGGADGLDRAVLDKAQMSLSLGAMTWPHMLVRGMLAEQLYRAQQILAGHPYHRA